MILTLSLIWIFSFILLEILFYIALNISFTKAFFDEVTFRFPPIIWYNNILILVGIISTLIGLPLAAIVISIIWILDNK